MVLPPAAHTSRPWRIHELTRDFRLEDVWALPTPGGPDDSPAWLEGITAVRSLRGAPRRRRERCSRSAGSSASCSACDDPDDGVGGRVASSARPDAVPTCAARPARAGPAGASVRAALPRSRTSGPARPPTGPCTACFHLGWVPDGDGSYRGQLAVLVKPNGLLGRLYMAAIRPFRHLVVYPSMLRALVGGSVVETLSSFLPASAR